MTGEVKVEQKHQQNHQNLRRRKIDIDLQDKK